MLALEMVLRRMKIEDATVHGFRSAFRSFAANAARLQLYALAYNLGNFMRTLATPEPIVRTGR